MNTKLHFSSKKNDWETPDDLFNLLNKQYGFTLDVCATAENAKCKEFFTIEDDDLKQDWTGVCWMNPPYGRDIGKWLQKAYESYIELNTTVVCLVPARTDTKWWRQLVDYKSARVELLTGRIKFVGAVNCAPFPSALIYYGEERSWDTTFYSCRDWKQEIKDAKKRK